MTITHVQPDDHHHLREIANLLDAASKIVTVTGAGISTKAGIPDFRSKNKTGIYSTGYRNLFRSSALSHPEDKRLFYKHIADMCRAAENANPTRTHHFIRHLRDSRRLVRDYTQNIDCLEDKVGLSTDIQEGPGGRFRFRKMSRLKRVHRIGFERRHQDNSRGVDCVLLHGSLRSLRCSSCPGTFCRYKGGQEIKTLSGSEPPCPGCTKISDDRKAKGKRATAIGRLRPDIVLYDEQDPRAEFISAIVRHDQLLHPDVLLIMGTSLATHGVQLLIRDFAKVIHGRPAGKVVFVNLTEPAKSWDGVIDYWVEWECDAWVEDLAERRPTLCGGKDGQDGRDDEQLDDERPGSSRENPIYL